MHRKPKNTTTPYNINMCSSIAVSINMQCYLLRFTTLMRKYNFIYFKFLGSNSLFTFSLGI